MVLFGGDDDRTWHYDGITWIEAVHDVRPPAGSFPIAYDAARDDILLYAGSDETWLYGR